MSPVLSLVAEEGKLELEPAFSVDVSTVKYLSGPGESPNCFRISPDFLELPGPWRVLKGFRFEARRWGTFLSIYVVAADGRRAASFSRIYVKLPRENT